MLTKNDLKSIAEIVNTQVEKHTSPIKKDMNHVKNGVGTLQKDVRVMLAILDRADVELRKRVERIEEHLGLKRSN